MQIDQILTESIGQWPKILEDLGIPGIIPP